MTYKEIYLSLFGVTIHYFRGGVEESNALFSKKFKGAKDLATTHHLGRHMTMECDGGATGDFVIWMEPEAKEGTLAHEVVHTADRIIEYIGLDKDGDRCVELRGYMTSWLIDRILGYKKQ